MAMVMVRSPYVSFPVQASSEMVAVTDKVKEIRLWPVLAQTGAVSGLWSAPASPQALMIMSFLTSYAFVKGNVLAKATNL
jgi:hypothetical protein